MRIDVDHTTLWRDHFWEFIEYGAIDVIVNYLLDKEYNLYQTYDSIARLIGATYNKAKTPMSQSDVIGLKFAHSKGIALPTKHQGLKSTRKSIRHEILSETNKDSVNTGEEEEEETFRGGLVFVTRPGLSGNGIDEFVISLDYKSLYLTLGFIWLNIGPDTKITPQNRPDPDPGIGGYIRVPLEIGSDKYVYYRKDIESVNRMAAKFFVDGRDIIKMQRDRVRATRGETAEFYRLDREQRAAKLLGILSYGTMGARYARMYDVECSSSVTAAARIATLTAATILNGKQNVLDHLDEEIPEHFFDDFLSNFLTNADLLQFVYGRTGVRIHCELIGGDTDSIFCLVKGADRNDIIYVTEAIQDYVNRELAILEDLFNADAHTLLLRAERINSSMLFLVADPNIPDVGVKKRYSYVRFAEKTETGWITSPRFKGKGLDWIKTNCMPIAGILQERIHKLAHECNGNDKTLKTELRRMYKRYHDFSPVYAPDLYLSATRLGKDIDQYTGSKSPHVRAAEYSNIKLGTNFEGGDTVYWTYAKNVRNGLIACETPKDFPKESAAYINHKIIWKGQIAGKLKPVADTFGIDWNYVESGRQQTSIGDWFS
jgi:DNA polymerase elongation subunit (family B)